MRVAGNGEDTVGGPVGEDGGPTMGEDPGIEGRVEVIWEEVDEGIPC